MSPPINIKDEPIDEGYDAALLPQSSIRQIKEELEHQEVSVGRESYQYTSAAVCILNNKRGSHHHQLELKSDFLMYSHFRKS